MLEEVMVYALIASKGDYDDYRSWTESIHKTHEGAEKAKQIFDEAHLFRDVPPMTKDQWTELDYGLDLLEAEKGVEVFVDRGGFTAEQFKLMDSMMTKKHEGFHPCTIEEYNLEL